MAGLMEDTSGQWIVLSGLTVSISLIAVAVFMNQAATTGYHSANAVLEFPKDEIRELVADARAAAKNSAMLAYSLNNTSNESVLANLTPLILNYSSQVEILYSAHGSTVNITLSDVVWNSTNPTEIDTLKLNITYNDGTTFYAAEPVIVEVGV
ncbi:hypothetical protein FHEFKHOI_01011 [Candidatus Methanoperedenaceae archaeon GB50]|nr:hypothetical protein AIOGIFDO_01005 [Candidatus Methanoperedenaceae archaeon GB37]CAD7771411.1 hypothetical protein FHEFKHOI_01011 [Candidatus Methanoperedenaceae archaeon GB50]CAD7776129.1 MAG: hypothetical protein KBONHNOK_00892 [Candidatus Methanoperedenaceae archaeon GB50]